MVNCSLFHPEGNKNYQFSTKILYKCIFHRGRFRGFGLGDHQPFYGEAKK